MKDGIKYTIGKTIKHIVVSEATKVGHKQIILVFSGDSTYEIYGADICLTSDVGGGGLEAAVDYAKICSAPWHNPVTYSVS